MGNGLDFAPGRSDQKGGASGLAGIQKSRCRRLVKVGRFKDMPQGIEAIKGFLGLLMSRKFHHLPVIFGVLAANPIQLTEPIKGMFFQKPQSVAPSNPGMLPGVTGKHDTGVLLNRQGKKPLHIINPDQSGFIQNNDAPGEPVLFLWIDKKFLQGKGRGEPILSEHIGCGSGGSAKRGRAIFQSGSQFLQGGCFARPGKPPKPGKLIRALQDVGNRLALIGSQGIRWTEQRSDGRERIASGIEGLNQRKFPDQNLPC